MNKYYKYVVRVCKEDNKPHIYTEYEFHLLQGAQRFTWECINKGYIATIFEIV